MRARAAWFGWVLGIWLLGVAGSASAQTCTASSTGLAFGSYSAGAASPSDTTATVTVSCLTALPVTVAYSVTMLPGASGSYAARAMAGPTSAGLAYQIYTDAARTQVWGDGTGATSRIVDSYLLGPALPVIRQYPAYGRLPARQPVAPGAYSDSIVVLITY